MEELFRYVCQELESRNIAYMLSGSVAMGAYSVSRLTRDIDIVIELADWQIDSFSQIFAKDFYFHRPSVEEEVQRRGMFNVIDDVTGFKIDFIVRKDTPFQQSEFSRRQKVMIWDIDCWLISLEDLILAKLIWIQDLFSERQSEDIRNLLIDNDNLDRSYLSEWVKALSLNTYNLLEI